MKNRAKKRSRVRAKLDKARVKPGRTDPSRTTTLRRAFAARVRRAFRRLKGEIVKAVAVDDWPGLGPSPLFPTRNIYCRTGPGGGIDPSCSQDERGGGSGDRPKLTKRLQKVLYEIDSKMLKAHEEFHATRVEKEAIFGGKLIPPQWVRIGDVQSRMTTADLEKLVASGEIEHDIAHGRIRRAGVPPNYYTPHGLTDNSRWRPLSDPDKVKAFANWLRSRVKYHLTSKTDEGLWRGFAEAGFKRGQARAWDDTKRIERTLAETSDPRRLGSSGSATGGEPGTGSAKLDFYKGSKDDFLRSAFGRPAAVDKVKLLAGRSFDDLEGITTDMSLRMSRVLTDGLVRGASPHEVGSDLADEVDLGADRAETIARTEIVRAHAEGQLDAMERLGVDEVGVSVEWSTAGPPYHSELTPKERRTTTHVCRLCEDLEGAVLSIEEAHGLLPRHPNCLVGDSIVEADDVVAVLEAHYTGQIVEIVTAEGRRLSVTPNHMMLTNRGFVQAQLLQKGQKVVKQAGRGMMGAKAPGEHSGKPRIADVFASLRESGLVARDRLPCSGQDFHGDGKSCDAEINVVRSYGELRNEWDQRIQEMVEPLFSLTRETEVECELLGQSLAAEFIMGPLLAADRSMGRLRELLAFLLGCLLHSQEHRLAAVAGLDTGLLESIVNDAATVPVLLRECLHAHPVLKQLEQFIFGDGSPLESGVIRERLAEILKSPANCIRLDTEPPSDREPRETLFVQGEHQWDEVIKLRRSHVVALPVYDVQTRSTVYRVNGLLSSNCRCAWVPAGVGEDDSGHKVSRKDVEGAEEEGDVETENMFCPTGETRNVFCPTGEGGGIDPSCPPRESGVVLKKSGNAAGRTVYHNPLAQSGRPYKYPGVSRIEAVGRDEGHPVVSVDPHELYSTQAHVDEDRLSKIVGAVRSPIIVVRHEGRLYVEEGNHRAVKEMMRGENVPAKIIDVAEKKAV